MNETLNTIAKRYTCRSFESTPLTEAQIKALVEAALAAPSGMNRQDWRVIVVTDKELIDQMDAEVMRDLAASENKASYERMMSRGGKVYYNAPCMIYIVAPKEGNHGMDCGIMSQNIALAAHALGLGSCICGMAGVPLSGSNGKEWMKRLSFPKGYVFSIAVLVGTAKTVTEPHAIDMSKVVYVQ